MPKPDQETHRPTFLTTTGAKVTTKILTSQIQKLRARQILQANASHEMDSNVSISPAMCPEVCSSVAATGLHAVP